MTAAATIKRHTNKARPTVKRTARGKKPPSMLARVIDLVPISAAMWQRMATWTILLTASGALLAIAVMLGIPGYLGAQMAEGVGRAGFAVKRVEVTGIDRMERLTVYAVALDQNSRAMPLVDLGKVRSQLLQYGWIKDARVSRRLPDTLVVDIVERKPAAVWQHGGRLSLIDQGGIVLEPVALNAMPDLPLVIGPDANVQATALTELVAHAPRLKPMLAGATNLRQWTGSTGCSGAGSCALTCAIPRKCSSGWARTNRPSTSRPKMPKAKKGEQHNGGTTARKSDNSA
jgi:cell division protein FtsQ